MLFGWQPWIILLWCKDGYCMSIAVGLIFVWANALTLFNVLWCSNVLLWQMSFDWLGHQESSFQSLVELLSIWTMQVEIWLHCCADCFNIWPRDFKGQILLYPSRLRPPVCDIGVYCSSLCTCFVTLCYFGLKTKSRRAMSRRRTRPPFSVNCFFKDLCRVSRTIPRHLVGGIVTWGQILNFISMFNLVVCR